MKLFALDPGNINQGCASGLIEGGDLYIGQTMNIRHRTELWDELVTQHQNGVQLVIVEEFRLYPEMARQQGYSDFMTTQVIGSVRFMSEYLDWFPFTLAKAEFKAKARRIGERAGLPGSIRMLGSGRTKYRGWDFQAKTQHERDAIAHLVYWVFRNEASPLYERDLKKESTVHQHG